MINITEPNTEKLFGPDLLCREPVTLVYFLTQITVICQWGGLENMSFENAMEWHVNATQMPDRSSSRTIFIKRKPE